jgi:hypothetical protein
MTLTLEYIASGDEVAILPSDISPPHETIEIATVAFVDDLIVRLTDNRIYSRQNRCGLTFRSHGFIEPATAAHRGWDLVEA